MTTRNAYLDKIQKLHHSLVLQRREDVLARGIAAVLPTGVQLGLDVGCGDGIIAASVAERVPGMQIQGVEVLDRETCRIPYSLFDGKKLPFPDGHFDSVQLVDVLHHTDNIQDLVGECARVSRNYVVIKDHTWQNRFDFAVLRFMDWIGNRAYGVNLIYNYQKKSQWLAIFQRCGLKVMKWNEDIGLYPFPFNLVFEKGKHFIVLLSKS
ncbi:MAG TPA: class I SAM-dependent methyltransferase [Dehalococcoidia bacterium]|nr:class I SAM-dependent methyltransferase [Dehalococcoidia bacterium]